MIHARSLSALGLAPLARALPLCAVLFGIWAASTAQAWGPKGHRAIALLAEQRLEPAAAIAVRNLIGPESLVDVSTWADAIRSDPDWSRAGPWHYVNIPDGQTYERSRKNPRGDAYSKLKEFVETLRSGTATKEEKAIALKWVTHLVGDLHMPLHVGRDEDRGGNDIEGLWFGRETNAHQIWDSHLIDATDYSFSELAESIDRRISVSIEPGPVPDFDLWMEESLAYRDRAYALPEPNFAGTYRYIFENLGLAEQRIKQGGLRLALTLNYALGDGGEWSSMPLDLHWMRNAAEYPAITRQTFQLATLQLERLVADGSLGPDAPWAVSLDADETVLDNSQYAKERAGRPFETDSWDDWCRRQEATAIPGAVAFARRVKELGGHVAIVSNRSVRTQRETEANLRALGVPFDFVMLKDQSSDKTPRWEAIESGQAAEGLPPMRIAQYVGDSVFDFPGMSQALRDTPEGAAYERFGSVYFALPNPTYGSWVGNPRR